MKLKMKKHTIHHDVDIDVNRDCSTGASYMLYLVCGYQVM